MDTFAWIHLTDFHQGIGEQGRLWPAQRHAFFDDLPVIVNELGGVDAVFFTGDLVQSGSATQFEKFGSELNGIRAKLQELGATPPFFFIPGNHDLARPSKSRETAAYRELVATGALKREARDDLFVGSRPQEHRRAIAKAFKEYSAWAATVRLPGLVVREGRLPGDFAAEMQKGSLRVGIVGLNSAFLQLGGGDFERRLLLDISQLQAVCEGDGPGWARRQDVTVLLTHHPVSWLTADASSHFRSEIAPHFDLHLHGHLHDGDVSAGWSRNGVGMFALQARSLCGLETVDPDGARLERTHGYMGGRLERPSATSDVSVRLWPRRAVLLKGQGGWEFVADAEFSPDSSGATEAKTLRRRAGSAARTSPSAPSAPSAPTTPLPASTAPGIPPGLRPPLFVPRGRSTRLDAAADEVLAQLDAGTPIVALRGGSGEGKTQVLRQIAAARDGYYIDLVDAEDCDAVLRQGLSLVVELFGEPSCAQRPLATVCAIVRNRLYRERPDPLLILDGLDAPCSHTMLELLLDATGKGAIVVAGVGVSGVVDVRLGAADETAFEQAFADAAALSVPMTRADHDVLVAVGAAVGFSPLRAHQVAQVVSARADISAALEEYRAAMNDEPVEVDARTAASVAKVWKYLTGAEKTRVALVAILGEPGIPASWLPRDLRLPGTSHAPLVTVTDADRAERHLEVHRTVAGFARREGAPDLGPMLLDLLEAWVADDQLLDERKAHGARSRAIVRGYRYLHTWPGIRATPSARVMKAYVDAAREPTPAGLVRHMSFVVGRASELASLPLEVVGELAEQIPQWAASKNGELHSLRTAAVDRLVALARSQIPVPAGSGDAAGAMASAMHHAAKALLRTGVPEDVACGTARLQELERRCGVLLAAAPTARRHLIDLGQIRLQLARSSLIPPDERVKAIRAALDAGGAMLPVYLRLALLAAALDVKPSAQLPADDTLMFVAEGLGLCGPQMVIETQVHFLRAAIAACDRSGADASIWRAISAAASALIAPLGGDVLGDRSLASLGYALVKGVSQDYTRAGVEMVLRALKLFDHPVEKAGIAVLSRLGAALREIDVTVGSVAIAQALYNAKPATSRYFETFELAKALRWSGEYERAVVVVALERDVQRGNPGNMAALGDELVKSAIRVPARAGEVRAILEANIASYRNRGLDAFADRCARWLATLDEEPISDGGVAEDEYRAKVRRACLTSDELEVASALAQRAAIRAAVACGPPTVGPPAGDPASPA